MKQIDCSIRVIIPAYNADKTLAKCVDAIVNATYLFSNCELTVVDNGLNTNIEVLLKNYFVRTIHKNKYASAAYARNEGASDFIEGIIIFIDSDVIVEKECLNRLIEPILAKDASATIGNYSKDVDGLNFAQSYKQLYIHHIYYQKNTFIQNDYWTAISAVDASAFHYLKGFNTAFQGANGEDQEFGIRLTKNDFRTTSVSNALGKHLNPYSVKKIIHNDFRKGMTAMSNSLGNQVPLNDNRHAKMRSIIAVLLGTLVPISLVLSIFFKPFLGLSITLSLLWFISRLNLIRCFLQTKGPIFLIKSIILIYVLDLVRFTCVVSGYTDHWIPGKTKLKPDLRHE